MSISEARIWAAANGVGAVTSITGNTAVVSTVDHASYTNISATSDITLTLSAAVRGRKFYVLNENRVFALHVDCQFTDRFRGIPSGSDVTLRDDSGMGFECLETGVWDVVNSYGVPRSRYYPNAIPITGSSPGRTIYWNGAAADDSGDALTLGAAKKTLRGIKGIARPGDLVLVSAGTYADVAENQWVAQNIPRGNQDFPIYFRCDTAFGARFTTLNITTGSGSIYDLEVNDFHVDCKNLVWWNTTTNKQIAGRNMRFKYCGFVGGPSTGNNHNFTTAGSGGQLLGSRRWSHNLLFEDCVFAGLGGRKLLQFYAASNCIARRCVLRPDGGWTYAGSDQASGASIYDSINCEFQNVIVLDGVTPSDVAGWGAAMSFEGNYLEHHGNAMRGCMVLDVDGKAFQSSGLYSQSVAVPSSGTRTPGAGWSTQDRAMRPDAPNIIEDCAGVKVLKSSAGFRAAFQIDVGPVLVRNCLIANLNRAGEGFGVSAGGPAVRSTGHGTRVENCVSVPVIGGSTAYNIPAYIGANNNLTYADIAAMNAGGIYHVTYADVGGAAQVAGAGPFILKRIGQDWAYRSYQTYRDVGPTDLWPWENEAAIKTFLQSVDTEMGITPRGFTASGSTLTQYVFGLLGTAGPI